MTIKEAVLVLNANVVFACGRAGFDSATIRMIEDALDIIEDALKAQEPRVMTLDEFMASECNPKWLETKDERHNRWTLGNAGYDKFYDAYMIGYLSIENYGKTWRCWTSRPSDGQRKAVKWDD